MLWCAVSTSLRFRYIKNALYFKSISRALLKWKFRYDAPFLRDYDFTHTNAKVKILVMCARAHPRARTRACVCVCVCVDIFLFYTRHTAISLSFVRRKKIKSILNHKHLWLIMCIRWAVNNQVSRLLSPFPLNLVSYFIKSTLVLLNVSILPRQCCGSFSKDVV